MPRSPPRTIARLPLVAGAVASRELFVDTSAWFPLLLRRHPEHAALTAVLRRRVAQGERIVTTNLVLSETHTLLLYRGHRAAATAFIRAARETPNVIVSSTSELEEHALTGWLDRYDDQDFSFTDAVSFAVMDDRRIGRALTLDRHFAAAGFEMLTGAAGRR
ncbi:MAG TPA: PIN domain-containing protein [Gemmatimonadaceae bacterium]|jgi:hypothetical protein|nr:PIN domain-containing protein [Gemmatimonadaceae bacterium]